MICAIDAIPCATENAIIITKRNDNFTCIAPFATNPVAQVADFRATLHAGPQAHPDAEVVLPHRSSLSRLSNDFSVTVERE